MAAAALGVAAIGGLAWALSTGPLVPAVTAAGSTAGSGTAAAAAGSAPSDPSAEGAADAAGEPKADEREDAGEAADSKAESDEDGKKAEPAKGEGGKGQTSSKYPSKPGQGGSAPSRLRVLGLGVTPARRRPDRAHRASRRPPSLRTSTAGRRSTARSPSTSSSGCRNGRTSSSKQERYRCTTCGATYYSLGEMNAHLDSTIDWDTMTGHAGYLDDSYDVWEKRDNGSYQTVQTGTKQVLDHCECSCGKTK